MFPLIMFANMTHQSLPSLFTLNPRFTRPLTRNIAQNLLHFTLISPLPLWHLSCSVNYSEMTDDTRGQQLPDMDIMDLFLLLWAPWRSLMEAFSLCLPQERKKKPHLCLSLQEAATRSLPLLRAVTVCCMWALRNKGPINLPWRHVGEHIFPTTTARRKCVTSWGRCVTTGCFCVCTGIPVNSGLWWTRGQQHFQIWCRLPEIWTGERSIDMD